MSCTTLMFLAVLSKAGDLTAPLLLNATISTSTLTLYFDEDVNRGAGYNDSDITLDMSVTGAAIGVIYVGGDGSDTFVYTTLSAAEYGETVTFNFNGDVNSLENNIGLDFAYISGGAVTNLTPVSPGTANLLAYWTLDDVGSPTTWLDSVGTYNLTNSGTVSSNASGNIGGCAHFDDALSNYLFNNSFSNNFHSGDFTVGGWVNMDQAGDDTIIAGQYAGGTGSGKRHWALVTGSDNIPQFLMYNTAQVPFAALGNAALSPFQWHHVCGVKNSNLLTIYVNGVAQTTTAALTGTVQTSAQPLNLGRYFDAVYYDGKLDDVFIYDRALTIEEIGFFVAGNSYTDL